MCNKQRTSQVNNNVILAFVVWVSKEILKFSEFQQQKNVPANVSRQEEDLGGLNAPTILLYSLNLKEVKWKKIGIRH